MFNEANWASDVSKARRSRQERRDSGGEKEASGVGVDPMGNKSGYGSEPAYRGDVEFGYGDEYDDEEEDVKLLFWGGMEYGMNEDSLREAFRKYGDVVESKNTGRGGLGLLHSPLPRRPLVLSKIMESDEFKASSKLETVTFSEMKQEEIEVLVEFMYCVVGSISLESLKKHVG